VHPGFEIHDHRRTVRLPISWSLVLWQALEKASASKMASSRRTATAATDRVFAKLRWAHSGKILQNLASFGIVVLERRVMPDEILTLPEVATLLKVADNTVYTMAQKSETPAFKFRGQWRFKREDIDAWIEQQKSTHLDDPGR
jgi:excisionase family DNA binding protein